MVLTRPLAIALFSLTLAVAPAWGQAPAPCSEAINSVRIEELDKRSTLQFQAARESVAVASEGLNKRLDGMNEFRKALTDQAGSFITRQEFAGANESIRKDIKTLELSKAEIDGKASQSSTNIALVLSVIGTVIAIATLALGGRGRRGSSSDDG